MIEVYAQVQVNGEIVVSGDNVTKSYIADGVATDGSGTHTGGLGVSVTLPFDAPQHKWTQAIVDAVVSRLAAADVEAVGGYRVMFVYLADLVSIKP